MRDRLIWDHQPHDEAASARLVAALGIHPVIAHLLCVRGLQDPDAATRFLKPSLADLHDPMTLAGMREAVLKGDRIDDVIRDAVMMGVTAVQPMLTARTDVPSAAFSHGGRVERWQRIAIASAKQCGRAVVPAVRAPLSLPECLGSGEPGVRLVLLEPSAAESGTAPPPPVSPPASATLLVGPEGGWAEEEVALALSAGWRPMSLGPRTLRADAAALVALSILQYLWR